MPRFLRSLFTNLTSDFRNSKWQIQYGGHKILETLWFSHNYVLGSFWGCWLRISNCIFRIPYSGSNMVDLIFRNLFRFIKILCLDVSWGLCSRFRYSALSLTQRLRRGRGRNLSPSGCLIRVSPLASHWNMNPLSDSPWNTDYRMVIYTLYRKFWSLWYNAHRLWIYFDELFCVIPVSPDLFSYSS